jgi:hypothetical protein
MRGGYFIYPYGSYANLASFPTVGIKGTVYIDEATSQLYVWDGSAYDLAGGGSSAWGGITGTLSAQTDLQAALDARDLILDPAVNPDLYFIYQTDFTEADRATLNVAASGLGSSATNDSTFGTNTTENARGVYDMSTGTTSTGRCSIYSAGTWVAGTHKMEYGVRLASSVALSDATDTYTIYAGYADNPGAGNVTDGIYFQYTHGTNGGRWQAIVADAGSRTAADTGVAPTNQVFQSLRIVVNQAGTQALFYIDGTLTNTVSAGLPGVGDFFLWVNKIEKSVGTASRTLSVDWIYDKVTRSTAR